MKLTALQRGILARAVKADGAWIRSQNKGERVTFASLYYRGILERRAWRVAKNSADNANEYRASKLALDTWKSIAAARESDAKPSTQSGQKCEALTPECASAYAAGSAEVREDASGGAWPEACDALDTKRKS